MTTKNTPVPLGTRLLCVMEECRYVQREDKTVPGMGFRPLSRNSVVAAVRQSLVKHGVCIVTSECLQHEVLPFTSDKGKSGFLTNIVQGYRVFCADNPSDSFSCSVFASGADASDRGALKALTSSEKQLFVNLFHIEIGDDEAPNHPDTGPEEEPISPAQSAILSDLAKAISVSPSVVATSVGVESIDRIPASRFDELAERLRRRAEQLKSAPKT